KEIGGAADGIGLEALLDRVLHVLGGHLAEAFVEHHARAQLERPRAHLARGLPLGGEAGLIREGLRIALDERIEDVIPQGLLGLRVPPGQRRFGAPLPDGDDEPIALGRGAGAQDEGAARREERNGSCPLEKDPTPHPSAHRHALPPWSKNRARSYPMSAPRQCAPLWGTRGGGVTGRARRRRAARRSRS